MANLKRNIVAVPTSQKPQKKFDLFKNSREKVAMQYTIRSAIANEFKVMSVVEKGIMALLIQSVLTQAINTGKSPIQFITHDISPAFLNDLLSYFTETGIIDKKLKCLSLNDIEKNCDILFERDLNYHDYDKENHLMICQARLIVAVKTAPCINNPKIIDCISVDIGIVILRELESIIHASNRSLEIALRLANHLLNGAEPTKIFLN